MSIVSSNRAAIDKLQVEMLKRPQLELETLHYFADGMYLRWLFRPKDTLIVGKVHKKEHFYLCIQGAVMVTNGTEKPREVRAPAVIVSQPGTKRAVYALEDSVCITVHRTDKTDLEEIEAELVEPDELSPYLPGNRLKPIEITECHS